MTRRIAQYRLALRVVPPRGQAHYVSFDSERAMSRWLRTEFPSYPPGTDAYLTESYRLAEAAEPDLAAEIAVVNKVSLVIAGVSLFDLALGLASGDAARSVLLRFGLGGLYAAAVSLLAAWLAGHEREVRAFDARLRDWLRRAGWRARHTWQVWVARAQSAVRGSRGATL